MELATFGAGCFWGVEQRFRQAGEGISKVTVGYAGGDYPEPTYNDVCSGKTGHAEVVQIEFDPAKISYQQLLRIFWDCHTPTSWERQGPDVGSQYRSIILYHTPEQEKMAQMEKQQLERSGKYAKPIVTLIEPLKTFWPAEAHHQRYYEKHGMGSCKIAGSDDQ